VRFAQALRRLVAKSLSHDCSGELLRQMSDTLENYVERIGEAPRSEVRKAFGDAASDSDRRSFRENSPLLGSCNPVAPPMTLTVNEDDGSGHARIEGTGRFGWAYEGPPGHVHGGFVAAVFDELLGHAQTLSGTPGLTAKLTIRFREPTPLHTDLRLVGLFERVDGRRISTRGKLFSGETLTADAQGLFMRLHPEHVRDLEINRKQVMKREQG